jgi:riboflavin kinase/FMN adenylyltransferase
MIEEYYLTDKTVIDERLKKAALCLGFFDGVHLGHQSLIKKAVKENGRVGVVTFDGSVKSILGKRNGNGLITSVEDRRQLLSDLGVSYLFVIPFNEKVMNMTPEEFIGKVLSPLQPSRIYIGSDFRFGKNAAGDEKLLKKFFNISVVPFVLDENGQKISASAIIKYLEEGKIEEANASLGRFYSISGEIVHGLENGKVLGFPTANLKPDEAYVIPARGVYATYIFLDGKRYLSMTDIGFHPTIDKLKHISIETNIFDFTGNIYSEKAKLEFLSYIRPEMKFDGVDGLIEQLKKDREEVQHRFN